MTPDAAAAEYALLGRKLYRENLTKGERRKVKQERRALLAEFGPQVRRGRVDSKASRRHFTVMKPREAGVLVMVLDPDREPILAHFEPSSDLQEGNLVKRPSAAAVLRRIAAHWER